MTTQYIKLSCNVCGDIDSMNNHSDRCRGTISRVIATHKRASPAEIMSIFGVPAPVVRQSAPAPVVRQSAPAPVVRQSANVEYKTPQKQRDPLQVPNAPRKSYVRSRADENSQGSTYEAWRYLPNMNNTIKRSDKP